MFKALSRFVDAIEVRAQNRHLKKVMLMCADGLSDPPITEAVQAMLRREATRNADNWYNDPTSVDPS